MIKRILMILFVCLLFCSSSPVYSEEKITKEIDLSKPIDSVMLDSKTLQELWLLRNQIYARHGKPMKTYELHAYFLSKGYKPDQEYSDSRLSQIELNNIELIRLKENELLKKNYVMDEKGNGTVNLGNILNQFQFGKFTSEQNQKLTTDGFFVAPAKHEHLFHVYENNDYLGIPNFITTDTVLQVYSVFFDFTLRHIEEEFLSKKLETLSSELLKHSRAVYKDSKAGMVKQAAKANLAYFTVPYYFLTGDKKSIGKEVYELVMQETKLTEAHLNIAPPPILKSNKPNYEKLEKSYWVDYSQFIPRGHYTRSETLKKYFMASLWFGLYPLHAEKGFEYELLQGLITTHLLYKKTYNGKPLLELWKDIYEPTAFYVGLSDDLGPDDFKTAMDVVYGDNPRISDFADANKLKKVQKILLDRFKEKTRIKHVFNGESQGPRFMLMSQRYIPDSEIMQRLVSLKDLSSYRAFPKGLDVMAVFGSKLSKKLMLSKYADDWQKGFPDYPKELEKLSTEFGRLKELDWKRNLYSNWVWSLKSLLELSAEHKYPFFMSNEAWSAKSLNTALASWAELRHHTILYAKQSFFGVECGGGGEEQLVWVPDPPKGYVEPNVEFYKRLKGLLEQSKNGLEKRGMIDEKLKSHFKRFIEMVTFLEGIAVKELKDAPRTIQEYEQIRRFGSLLESLTFDIYKSQTGNDFDDFRSWSEIVGPDRRIPLIADVHTAYEFGDLNVLEEGVGFANEIYVAVEIEGKLKLTKGAVFSYYEFKWPAADRLTDEKWQEMLDQGNQPPVPDWTDMFMSKEPHAEDRPAAPAKAEDAVPAEGDVSIPISIPPSGNKPGWQLIHYDTGC